MSELPPPGFYPDANGDERWWDGSQWTEQVKPPADGLTDGESGPESGAESGGQRPPVQDEGQTQIRPAQPSAGTTGAAWQPQDQAPGQQWPAQQYGAQPYGSQQYGAPYGQGAGQAPQKSKTPWIIAAIIGVLVLIIGIVLAVVLLSGDDDDNKDSKGSDDRSSQATDGPSDDSTTLAPGGDSDAAATTVDSYLSAVTRQDCTGMQTYLTGAAKSAVQCDGFTPNPGYDAGYEVLENRMVGDKAEVDTTEWYSINGGEKKEGNCTYTLTEATGEWLIERATCK